MLIALGIAGTWLFWTYNSWASELDRQLASSSLSRPAGLYARPRRLKAGEPITREQIVERLRRSGYGEGTGTSEFATGGFQQESGEIEVSTNNFYVGSELPARLRITLNGNSIARIEDLKDQRSLKSILMPAELLTCDPDSKQQAHSATSFQDLPRTLVDAVCAIEDRSFFSA